MTEEVAELVLDDNRDQTLALTIARAPVAADGQRARPIPRPARGGGLLDRALEHLPTDKQIAERQSLGIGLCAPEFAVMIAYTKSCDIDEILEHRPARRSGRSKRTC